MKQFILCILDGWGHAPKTTINAISHANTPFISYAQNNHPNALLEASGSAVGLPEGQMGNSEVGHLTIGTGRIVPQSLKRINAMIQSQEFFKSPVFTQLISILQYTNKACHILGLISDGGIHSHIDHIIAIIKFLRLYNIKVHLHAITDGRDTAPKSALKYINHLSKHNITITTIGGRYYAMDRDKRWDRVSIYYNAITKGKSRRFSNVMAYIHDSYSINIFDEFILPAVQHEYNGFAEGDVLICANFRADRVRQILNAIANKNFTAFITSHNALSYVIGIEDYGEELSPHILYINKSKYISNTLGETISSLALHQLRLAETEKYAHVTYFLNGGRESPYSGEDRILIPSPLVTTYDQRPEMSAYNITDAVIQALQDHKYTFLCINFANADMVGHSGNFEATKRACEVIDECLSRIASQLPLHNAEMIITADHGNAEQLFCITTNQPHTAHTINKVPIIYLGNRHISLKNGCLADVAPTMLEVMNIDKPIAMTGKSLITS